MSWSSGPYGEVEFTMYGLVPCNRTSGRASQILVQAFDIPNLPTASLFQVAGGSSLLILRRLCMHSTWTVPILCHVYYAILANLIQGYPVVRTIYTILSGLIGRSHDSLSALQVPLGEEKKVANLASPYSELTGYHPGTLRDIRTFIYQVELVGHGADASLVARPHALIRDSQPGRRQTISALNEHYVVEFWDDPGEMLNVNKEIKVYRYSGALATAGHLEYIPMKPITCQFKGRLCMVRQ